MSYTYKRTWYIYKSMHYQIKYFGTYSTLILSIDIAYVYVKKNFIITFTVYYKKCLMHIKEHGTSTNI